MKALEISDTRTVSLIEKPAPEITAPDDVIVEIKAVSICGTDVHTFLGEHPFVKPPVVIGHECSGVVTACGSEVENVQPGDRVAVDPVWGCGTCRACTSGRANACATVKCRGVHSEGAMQEYFKVRGRDVHKMPDSLEDIVLGAVIEPLAVGAQACWRGDVRQGDVVVIFGAGPIGIAVMLNAMAIGAECVLVDMKQDRLARAEKLGAVAAISASDPGLVERVLELTGSEGAQVTCDAVGHPAIYKQCVELVAPTGSVVLLGMDGRANEVTELQIFRKEMNVVGSRMNSNMFPLVLERIAEGKMDPAHLLSHRFSMDEAGDAFRLAVEQPDGFLKSTITF